MSARKKGRKGQCGNVVLSARFRKLPPYLFAELDRKKKELESQGRDIINLGVGDPDRPTPAHIVRAMQRALEDAGTHRYPFGAGLMSFRQAVAQYYRKRFNVALDPYTEVQALIGSKEGIGHLPLACVDRGDTVLVPEPGYPVYRAGTVFAGGTPYFLPLTEDNGYWPELRISPKALNRTKLLFLNYPNNPTAATATEEQFSYAIRCAQKYGFIIAHDAAYSEIYFAKKKPISFLQVKGAKDIGVEFGSLSKTYNMSGWRIGYAAGSARIIRALASVKDNYDSGVFEAVQRASVCALVSSQKCARDMRVLYRGRRDVFTPFLERSGWSFNMPQATFYIWARVPRRTAGSDAVSRMLGEEGIMATPGGGFGPSGIPYVRFALTVEKDRLLDAGKRIEGMRW